MQKIFKFEKIFLYLSLLLLPLNLGKHFVFKWNYFNGILVDYFIPTIYIPELLILVVLAFWFFRIYKSAVLKSDIFLILKYDRIFYILAVFIFCIFLSCFYSQNILASIYLFSKWLLYLGFFVHLYFNIDEGFFKNLLKIFAIQLFLLTLLSIGQWYKQSSVFDNYLFFGEQPYNFSTPNVAKENFLGFTKLGSYGLFRHPNIFAGYMSILLCAVFFYLKAPWVRALVIFSILGIFFTLSYYSFFVLVFGLVSFYALKNYSGNIYVLLAFVLFLGVLLSFIPLLDKAVLSESASLEVRSELIRSTANVIESSFLFGVGPGMNIVEIQKFLPLTNYIIFIQPVHNIFLLLLSEFGFFGLICFLTFLVSCIYLCISRKSFLSIVLLQFVLLGFFDHFPLTIHQTAILFMVFLALSLRVTRNDYV